MTSLSYARGAADVALLDQTVGEAFAACVGTHGARDAVISCEQGVRLTYQAFDERVSQCARALLGVGVAVGDRVGVFAPNCVEWMIVQYAAARTGAILVNVNPSYRAHELEFALRQSGVATLFHAPSFKDVAYRPLIDQARSTQLERVIEFGSEWDAFLEHARGIDDRALVGREAALNAGDPINIQYTSGTTGSPKGATLSHRNILNNGYLVGRMCGYTPQDRICVPVPFYHCFGMVMGNLAALCHGACIVIPSQAFDPRAVLEAVHAERCTSLYGVPTMFIAVLADPQRSRYDVSSLRTGIMAGSPCPVEVMKRVRSDLNMDEVTICYGMTETSPVSTQTRRDDPVAKRVGSVGQVHPHLEVMIVDPLTREVVERGVGGELCTRGYSVMLGYWANPEATAAAIDEDGYMHTGDLATMDTDGYVNIVGRIKDVVIRGGENISPREVEEFLYTHPGIRDVQVFGVPDERYGEELAAWVIPADGVTLTVDDVRGFCDGQIARFKIPRYIRFVDAFPLTVTGKVQKFVMREREIDARALQHAAATRTA
jgi:fatty-acyl-CoA synthase